MSNDNSAGHAAGVGTHRAGGRRAAFGLTVALVLPVVASATIAPEGVSSDGGAIAGLTALWLIAATVTAHAVYVEELGWTAVGIRRLSAGSTAFAVTAGLALMLLVPLLSFTAAQLLPTGGGTIGSATQRPWSLVLAAVITAAVTEEVLFRAYPVERLWALTKSPWPGAVLGLIAFVLLHAGSWNAAHVVGVVLPLGAMQTLLYVWRRNLVLVIIAHLVADLPLVILALAP